MITFFYLKECERTYNTKEPNRQESNEESDFCCSKLRALRIYFIELVSCGATCIVCHVPHYWSREQKNEQQNNAPTHIKQWSYRLSGSSENKAYNSCSLLSQATCCKYSEGLKNLAWCCPNEWCFKNSPQLVPYYTDQRAKQRALYSKVTICTVTSYYKNKAEACFHEPSVNSHCSTIS